MTSLFPLQLLLATFAGWTNRHQAQVIDYLVELIWDSYCNTHLST